MKTLENTTTGSLFNHTGILTHAGDYAGKYQDEAYNIINKIEPIEIIDTRWADIMVNGRTGKIYAVYAEGALTMQNATCLYTELLEEDCPFAFKDAKNKIEESED